MSGVGSYSSTISGIGYADRTSGRDHSAGRRQKSCTATHWWCQHPSTGMPQASPLSFPDVEYKLQTEALKTKPLIAVGTPGRLAELSRKGHLLSHKCPILVLDEVCVSWTLETVVTKWLLGRSVDQDSVSEGHAACDGTHWQETASSSSDCPLCHTDPFRGRATVHMDSRYTIRLYRISGSHSIYGSSSSRANNDRASMGMGQQMDRGTDTERYAHLVLSRRIPPVTQIFLSRMLRSACRRAFVMAMP